MMMTDGTEKLSGLTTEGSRNNYTSISVRLFLIFIITLQYNLDRE